MIIVYILFFLHFLLATSNARLQSLDGTWNISGINGDSVLFPGTVPGGIFSDAMANGIIPDIWWGTGDTDASWLGLSNITYSTTFTVTEDFLNHQVIYLIFDGIDTFATIYLNGVEIGKTENMFLQYSFAVREHLKPENKLDVVFESAVRKAAALAEDASNQYTLPPECPTSEYNGICHVNRIRKMQASFSWDWGPAFASIGIWKNVYLKAYQWAAIDYVIATPTMGVDSWVLSVVTYFNNKVDVVLGKLSVALITEARMIETAIDVEAFLDSNDEIFVNITLDVPLGAVKRWWPNGYGEQNLYNLLLNFEATDGEYLEDSVKTVPVGFRTIELVQEPISDGLSFYFSVNDVAIFAKGANQIPLNILPELGQNPYVIWEILGAARDTHMNMLRVWGGGVYESDEFYEVADQLGILIWQDFMFACALYPSYDEFLSNVKEEVKYQLKRLGRHPSIAIWSGNNENEAALRDDWWGVKDNFSQYQADYVKLYIDTIAPEVLRILPEAIFVPSSPSNGLKTADEGYVSLNPSDPLFGDVHFYDYTGNSWNRSTFPVPRFASEYGYQSYPSIDSFLTATNSTDDVSPTSDFMSHRQHHPNGANEMLSLISQQLQLPNEDSAHFAEAVIYFSQIVQAQAIKTETEHYRSYKGRLNELQQGNTMGALYWQLNDVWVAPTWSGIDYTGKWKMLQYFARNFFSPYLIQGYITSNGNLEMYVTFDGIEAPSDSAIIVCGVYRWDRITHFLPVQFTTSLTSTATTLGASISAEVALQTAGCGTTFENSIDNCFFYLRLMDEYNVDLAPPNYVFLSKLSQANFANAVVKIVSVTLTSRNDTFDIVLSTNAIALFVWLDSHSIHGRFSDNGFLLVEVTKTIQFVSETSTTAEQLSTLLTVTHLRDSIYL